MNEMGALSFQSMTSLRFPSWDGVAELLVDRVGSDVHILYVHVAGCGVE